MPWLLPRPAWRARRPRLLRPSRWGPGTPYRSPRRPPWASARDDLSDDVPERQSAGEAHDGPLADQLGRLVHRLIHRHLGLLDDPLRVLRVQVAQEAGAETVSRLLYIDHGEPSGARGSAERSRARACWPT